MANNPEIVIRTKADGAGITVIEGMFNAFLKRIGGKAAESGKIMKEMMGAGAEGGLLGTAAAFGAVAGAAALLTELGTHTAEWAHEIKEVADQMNISTDAAQQLSFAASLMGKDLQWAAGMLEKEELFLEKALGGQKKFALVASELGLSLDEMQHLDPKAAHDKILKAVEAGQLSDSEIARIYGRGNVRAIKSLAENESYADKYGVGLDPKIIAAAADEWRAWKTIFKDLGVALLWVGAILVAVVRILRKTFMSIFDIIIAGCAALVAGVFKILSKIPGFGYLGKEADSAWKMAKEYGSAAGQNMVEIVKPGGKQGQTSTDREPDMAAGKHLEKLEGNPFLKIGGLAGVDTNFRIERLTQTMVRHLANIDEHTKPVASTVPVTPPSPSVTPNYAVTTGPSGLQYQWSRK